ncbi:XRE family transcriptional regulator [Nocardia carnea]|uniref:XRE family transcriptional regulator n=1 Tax=Nocardia carnea TaxID=37328 RepID=UPI0024577FC2|nr:XRE family transcriptional regulator [Nocardia carnea]
MPNDRLRDALHRHGLDIPHVAEAVGVEEKTVERWITKGRTPYPRHRHTLASLVRETENYLWPDAVGPERRSEISESEVLKIYPHRNSIPNDLWTRLLSSTAERLDILVLAGLFMAEDPLFARTIRQRTKEGLQVRMLFGDPREPEATKRSAEERLAPTTVPARIQNALSLIQPLAQLENVDIRFHGTALYNSIFRFDDEMIVNMHVYGQPGAYAPAMHLRQLPAGDLFETYMTSFEQVWSESEPAEFEELR